jgi:DNA-binding transcriptional LysR family regulator
MLPRVLGRFARAHPKVRIEGRIARNDELLGRIGSGQLDLALAWDGGGRPGKVQPIAALPLCWLGAADVADAWRPDSGAPLPLVALEAPCLMRTIACDRLDRQGLSWRLAFVSPSLGGLWAATAAGLGVAVRTSVGHPPTVRKLEPDAHGLPELPSLGLSLYRADKDLGPAGEYLAAIILDAVRDLLDDAWLQADSTP